MKLILGLFCAAIPVGLFIYIDGAALFGAHPWWSQSSVLIGAVIGLGLALVTRGRGFAIFAFALLLASLATWFGKTQFAASFAEDVMAGRLWYFGWIAVGASATATLVSLWTSHVARGLP